MPSPGNLAVNGATSPYEESTGAGVQRTLWDGCLNGTENSIQQLSPYVGKLKSGMARALIQEFSCNGDTVLDPFCGSGVVPYEALLAGRNAVANDLNPYAFVLTQGKICAPKTHSEAETRALSALNEAAKSTVDVSLIPDWVRAFFHPKTLHEAVALMDVLKRRNEFFLMSCLLGILHHVRPGFLSYPASHLVPYLRIKKYPREDFPAMYDYRPVAPRLLAKVTRAYRRFEPITEGLEGIVLKQNAASLSLEDSSIDAIVSSPPYYGALDYGRDNRLRLWFLGMEDYKELEVQLTSNNRVYIPQMTMCLAEMIRVLKPKKSAVLVLGDYNRDGRKQDSATALGEIVEQRYSEIATVEKLLVDEIPDIRRTRRKTRTTRHETIIVITKRNTRARLNLC